MRNPNGYGTVVKLSGKRRRPYAIYKTVGWNERGNPIRKNLGYTATKKEAILILAEYNKKPWDIDTENTTLKDLYINWLEKKTSRLSNSTILARKSAFAHTKKYHNIKYKDIKSFHIQEIIDNCGCGSSMQSHIRSLFVSLDKFALELDIINKGYASLTDIETAPETSKKPFTDEEIQALWDIKDEPMVDTVLIFLYTGFRLSELLDMRIENVDLEQRTFKGGTKTKAGKNRIVPIHSKIFELVERLYDSTNKYLISNQGQKITTNQYYTYWNKIMKNLGFEHTPHECRHTFRSRLDSAGANKACIDLMMGHKSNDVGERVYTHKTIDELRNAIELITH